MVTETWILLRGLGREAGHWGPFLEIFKAGFPAAKIVCIDLPGAGQNIDVPLSFSMAGITDVVRTQALQAQEGELHVLALSLGAMVTLDWLNRFPGEVQAAVLMNASLKGLSPAIKRFRWQAWGELLRIQSSRDVREREKRILDLVCNSPEARARLMPIWTDLARRRPVKVTNIVRQIAAAANFKPPSRAPDTKGLILSGLGDRLVDPSCSENLHTQFHWPIERHPWAGHDLAGDDGEWVVSAIQKWLKNIQ